MFTAGSAWIPWNIFDFPAGILPITKVTEKDEENLNSTFPTNDMVNINKTLVQSDIIDMKY